MSDTPKEQGKKEQPATPAPKLIPLEGDGLVCDMETGVCSSPALAPDEPKKTDR